MRRKILELAGEVLKIEPSRLSLSEGKIIEQGVGERLTLKALLAQKFGPTGMEILGEAHFNPSDSPLLAANPGLKGLDSRMSSIFWMFATHAVEVEVDIETGVVKVLKVVAAHDVGRAINPVTCEQQIEGSVLMGLSNTLFEEFKMEKGRILNDSLSDYKLVTTLDMPEMIPIIVESTSRGRTFRRQGGG